MNLERVRRENVTEIKLEPIDGLHEDNYALEEFLECFPTVTREMTCRILERSEQALLSPAAA